MAEYPSRQLYCQTLDQLASAGYLISTDADFTIIYANAAFYQMIGYNREELQYRYGNRLSALVTGESLRSLRQLSQQTNQDKLCLEQQIRCSGSRQLWISTEATCLQLDDTPVIACICHDISAQKQTKAQLESCRSTLEKMSQITRNEVFIYDMKSQMAEIAVAGKVLCPVTRELQIRHQNFFKSLIALNIVDSDYALSLQDAFWSIQRGHTATTELKLLRSDDTVGWYRLTLSRMEDNSPDHLIGILEDISVQKQTSLQYLNETQYFQAILSEKDAYAQIDITEDRILRVGGIWNLYNELVSKITYSQLVTEFIYKVVHPDDRKHYLDLMQRDNFISSFKNGIDHLGCQFRRIVEQNKMVWMELSVHLLRDPVHHHVLALLSLKNIDDIKRRELQLTGGMERDQSTCTYSRQAAEQAIRTRLIRATEEDAFAFLILKIKNLEEVAQSYGQAISNSIILRLSHILTELFRKDDIIGRYSGQEFILFLPRTETRENVERILDRLYSSLSTDQDPPILCCIGITLLRGEQIYEQIFRQADAALEIALSSGGNGYYFYNEEDLKDRSFPSEQQLPPVSPESAPLVEQMSVEKSSSSDDQEIFENMLACIGDIAYLVNPQTFDLLMGNEAFYRRIGLTPAQCNGLKCYQVMQDRSTPCPFCGKINWSKDKFYLWRNTSVTLEQEFLIKNKMINWKGKDALLAIAVDISNNKSIVDSLDNSATESHSLLNGIQNMISSASLSESMNKAVEAVAFFFRAQNVRYWIRREDNSFLCGYQWKRKAPDTPSISQSRLTQAVSTWLCSREWSQPLIMESPQVMLLHSFEIYELLKEENFKNLHWFPVLDEDKLLGVIQVTDVTANIQNFSFMDAFTCFIISEQKNRAMVDKLLYSNHHDDLTGLLSRNSYDSFLFSYDSDQFDSMGVLIADINDLKGINSRLGFPVGDKLIKEFASMLLHVFQPNPVFRLNGDEFLVVAPNTDWDTLSEQMSYLESRVEEYGQFSVSMGRTWDNTEKSLSQLIEQAITVMKTNKQRFYESNSLSTNQNRQYLLQKLMDDLNAGKYIVYLQPKINMVTGCLTGAEALIRFVHDEHGILTPAYFIDNLEQNNFIRYIDLFVFEAVCQLLKQWEGKGYALPMISLNFSRQTLLEQDLIRSVEHIFERYQIPKKKLEIEITESIADMGKSALYQAAHDFYQAGYSISLDDFGTKYTNLAILSELQFDTLKLDRSLVCALEKQESNQIILKHMIAMCKDLHIDVIAEGVETPQQQECLVQLGCPHGQGYLFGKPMPIADFEQLYLNK